MRGMARGMLAGALAAEMPRHAATFHAAELGERPAKMEDASRMQPAGDIPAGRARLAAVPPARGGLAALAGAAQTCREFSAEELRAAARALAQPAMRRAHGLMNAVQFESMAHRCAALAARLGAVPPATGL